MAKRILVAVVLMVLGMPFASAKDKEGDPILPEVTARGRMLFEYDQAAWHATDAVQEENPPREALGRYIAMKSGDTWKVGFGHLNPTRDKFLVAYEAIEGASLENFKVKKCDPPREDASFYLFAARAIDTALRDFHRENRQYNIAVLPAPGKQLYVYIEPAQTESGAYPLGGDVRYMIGPDGLAISSKRQLHSGIIENDGQAPEGTRLTAGFHTHVLSDVPEDTDVFFVLTRRPSLPEYIGAANKKTYTIDTDGTIYEGKL